MEARKDINAPRTAEIHVAWLRFYKTGANNHNVHPRQKLWTSKKSRLFTEFYHIRISDSKFVEHRKSIFFL